MNNEDPMFYLTDVRRDLEGHEGVLHTPSGENIGVNPVESEVWEVAGEQGTFLIRMRCNRSYRECALHPTGYICLAGLLKPLEIANGNFGILPEIINNPRGRAAGYEGSMTLA